MGTTQTAIEKMKSLIALLISYVQLTRARNGEHFDFMYDIRAMIGDAKAALLGFADLWAEFKALFEIEDEAYKLIRGFELTSEVKRLDAERMEPYSFIMATVKAGLKSSKADVKQAATHLSFILKPFMAIHNCTMTDRSARLTNMVEDLQLPANTSAVTKLGLTADVTVLKTKNDLFKEIFLYRAEEKEKQAVLEKMATIRSQVDEAYRLMVEVINARFLANEVAATPDPALRSTLAILMHAINARVLELHNLIHNREMRAENKKTETLPKANKREEE